jgi:hypothetical protein
MLILVNFLIHCCALTVKESKIKKHGKNGKPSANSIYIDVLALGKSANANADPKKVLH